MKRQFAVAAVLVMGLGLMAMPVVAQESMRATAAVEGPVVKDAARAKVADLLSKGDSVSVEKILGEMAAGKANAVGPGNTTFEEIRSCGFYPQETRLECVVDIKQQGGYGGPIGSFGTFEYVAFYVDWQGNGFQLSDYVGSGIVHITDGSSGTGFAVYRDFNPPGGFRTVNNGGTAPTNTSGPILKVLARLQWGQPTTGPNSPIVWGNQLVFPIRMMPIR